MTKCICGCSFSAHIESKQKDKHGCLQHDWCGYFQPAFKALHAEFLEIDNRVKTGKMGVSARLAAINELRDWLYRHSDALLAALELAQQVEEMDRSRIAAIEDRIKVTERLTAENASLKAQLAAARQWRKCQTHGDIDGARQWGCPDCVAELRGRVRKLQMRLGRTETCDMHRINP